jgi:hypothetical protein
MSPELETLDQLSGGDLPLTVIRGLFPDEERCTRAILAMLKAGELRLWTEVEVPRYRWRDALSGEGRLSITDAGLRRIG